MKVLKNNIFLLLGLVTIFFLFVPMINGKIPIAGDALVGLYHPWRDALSNDYPNGIPVKNSLVTDPFRQQYTYRQEAIRQVKQGIWPVWNPYSFSGTPLLANIQTAFFYPLNILFWIFDFPLAWSLLVLLQPVLACLFTYAYLRNLNLSSQASTLGGVTFALSGFMVAWLTWNTIGHVALWMPLILLAKDKLIDKFSWRWIIALIVSESAMILAGHVQTALYVLLFTTAYLWFRLRQKHVQGQNTPTNYLLFFSSGTVVLFLTSIQWWPTLQFVFASARQFDLANWQRADWFLPVSHLVQFLVPDYFGNPTTGNYWGVWNYGEFVGYIGIVPLIFAIYTFMFVKTREKLFFVAGTLFCLIFASPNPIAALPYKLSIPFISTMQPSRILVLVDFSLSILAAIGFDHIVKKNVVHKKNGIFMSLVAGVFIVIAVVTFAKVNVLANSQLIDQYRISLRNLFFPGVFMTTGLLLYFSLRYMKVRTLVISLLIILTCVDLFRFSAKFTPFSDAHYLYPQTETINFLQKNAGLHRVMTTDRRIFPPNTLTAYQIQTVDGYDPLYLKVYGELAAAWTRDVADISPAAFNRIVTPEKYDSFITDLMGVKYVISLTEIKHPKLVLVFQEKNTYVYENTHVFPRAYIATEVEEIADPTILVEKLFQQQNLLNRKAFIEVPVDVDNGQLLESESITISHYGPSKVMLDANLSVPRLIVVTDIFDVRWKAYVDEKPATLLKVNHFFRGVVVESGRHRIIMHIN